MRILQLGKFYPIKGGVEKVMYDLMTGLSKKGVDCDMMCAASEGKTRVEKLNEHAKLICCHTLFKLAATMISPAMIWRLWKMRKQYDVIHVHHPDPMACLALFCSGFKGKVVLHWHSDILKQKMLLKFYKPLQSWMIRRADLVIGTTPVYLQESPFLKKVQHKTACLPIGILPLTPTTQGVEAIRAQYPGRRIVYSLGRLIGYKGFSYLVDAAKYLDDSYVVLIGGSGPLKEDLKRQVEEAGLQERVKLLGFVPDEMHADYFGACDVFCLSSIQKTEAFGIVQIEAMSCGKPVVTTRIPESGVPWVNGHEMSGLNVEPCDAEALAEAVREITKDEATYRGYSDRARERYEQLFTADKMIDTCHQYYKNIEPINRVDNKKTKNKDYAD